MSSRSNARIVRFLLLALFLISCGYILSRGSTYGGPSGLNIKDGQKATEVANGPSKQGSGGKNSVSNEPVKPAAPAEDVSSSPKDSSKGSGLSSDSPTEKTSVDGKVKATFVTLARNSDLMSLLGSIRQVEDRFNRRYHYDWVFLNDEPFDEEFKAATSALVSGTTKYGLIPKEEWSFPEWISEEKAALTRENMKNIIYGASKSYRFMCRYESGFFWRHELMKDYEYYWRVEPDIQIYCDIDYDVFKFMKNNNKKYGFTITLPEYKDTIPTLWDTTKKFIEQNKQYVVPNNLLEWISDDNGKTYNGCHFWSNFEVASLDLWRSEAYRAYFDHLDHSGGFFYERWGDAPVHSIAAALFLQKDQVHFFNDVGYYHVPFHNCPISTETRLKKNCVCDPNADFTWKDYSCTAKFHTINNLPRPQGWEKFAG
ncbi:Piso0_001267 [Millerozyma farinosa CBS 7064]|uniref:Piso0_001267 protein n=1 Tax=Pichia sorbitophila (strain ATCC MYA-4447 / BCRC 22081 / CBS 7064 / NBRC 10061 / NRRL Y-12695) TaxID=559304 RepID=G8YDW8_PICSO|nr:Piso0_001267 [Millerozyma farinosa CBS 7064]